MNKTQDCRTRLAQHRRLQFQDSLCTNVSQSGVTGLWAELCALNISKNAQTLPGAHSALTQ